MSPCASSASSIVARPHAGPFSMRARDRPALGRNTTRGVNGARRIGHRWHPRDRSCDLEGLEVGGLPGRRQLRRQRRGRTKIQIRDRDPGLQVRRLRSRRLRGGHQGGGVRTRPRGCPRQQCRHHPRRHVPPHDLRSMAGGDPHEPRLDVHDDASRHRRHAQPRLRAHHHHLVGQRPEGSDRSDELPPPRRPAWSASPRPWHRRTPTRA